MYSVDSIVYLHGKFALREGLVVHYTFVLSSLCVRNLLYKFLEKKNSQSSTVQLSMCEELLCVFLALFSYPYARNSYVHFVEPYF